ncbi:FecR protein [Trinickia sp. LjRoot230]
MLIAAAPFVLGANGAYAQAAPSPEAQSAGQSVDPPGRVARLNYMAGTVTTEPAGASDWSYASLNRPLTTGDQLWNDANARSELHIGSTAVRLGASTNLDVLNLDDTNAQLKVTQGTLSTRVRELAPGSSYEIDTPNVALAATQAGDYRIDVAPDGSTTTVTVRRGQLNAYGDNGQMPLAAGQQITFSGTNLQTAASTEAPPPDAFDQWAAARDAAADRSASARYVSREMPGYEDLDANGTWRNDPQYGSVWVPSAVPTGWAPYHDGHWAWVAPWGWTWVDDAPWGFAPYHYGRWAYVQSSWCWVPGPMASAPPVYAPALVAFVGGGGGGSSWSVGLTIGGAAAPGVAWFPLGPGEVWRPRYGGWSPRYFERVNQTVINNRNVNVTNININNIHNTYVNYRAPGAVTAVPATAFVQGRPVAHAAQRVDPQQWRNAQIHPGAPGIAPVRESYAPGQRSAAIRPPTDLAQRRVVATRAPAIPAVYHDPLAQRLAQSGALVPGAGRAVVRMTPPSSVAAQMAHPTAANPAAARNVRLVERQSPIVTPRAGAEPAAGRPRPAAAGPVTPGGGAPRPGPEQQSRALVGEAPIRPQTNGVPRPPAERGAAPAAQAAQTAPAAGAARHEPSWTQPHAPIAQQREPAAQPGVRGGAPAAQQPGAALSHQPERSPQVTQSPPAANAGIERQPTPHVPQPAAREPAQSTRVPAEARPQPQERIEPRVPAQQPMQPRIEPRAQPQPQPQPRFEQPRPQPQPQPHFEQPRPQPQPQPHFEQPRPQPQPQPQPHVEQPRPQPQQHEPRPQAQQSREGHHQG